MILSLASSKNIPIIEAKKTINFSLPNPPVEFRTLDSTNLTSPIFLRANFTNVC